MDAATATQDAIGKAKGARGRKDADKQEAATKPQEIEKRIDHLVKGYIAAKDAAEQSSDDIKAAAEASGYNVKNVRVLIVARVNDTMQERRRDAEQQLELFNEVGALGGKE